MSGRRARGGTSREPRVTARLAREAGQSSIELLGAIPLLLVVVLAAAQLLAAGAVHVAASSAAEAAAMAILQGGDPTDAARSAAPGWSHLAVDVDGRHLRVRLTPPNLLPGLASALATTVEADAGPEAEARAGRAGLAARAGRAT